MTKYFSAFVIAAAFALSGCVAADVPHLNPGERPVQTSDEAGIWLMMDKAEGKMKTSANVEKSPELNAYINELVCKVAAEFCADLRVYIINRPYFNAMMAPNGAMQVWSGLLLRADNEAQLVFVLGHEFGHYYERHSIEQWRTQKASANAAMFFSIGTAVAGVGSLGQFGQLVALSTIFGHSRDSERQADQLGFEFMTKAGYDGSESAEVWRYLVEEVNHSDFEKKRKKRATAGIFDTHPISTERIATLSKYAKGQQTVFQKNQARYREIIGPYLDGWLRAELRRKDYGETKYLIEKLIGFGRDLGVLYYYQGEVYRLRRNDGDIERSLQSYERALNYPDAPAVLWRELGQAYQNYDQNIKAYNAFSTYLEMLPDAQDHLIIEGYLNKLRGGLGT